MSESFDADMYPNTVRFFPPGSSDGHGSPVLDGPTGATTDIAAYVEPQSDANRGEGGYVPTGEKRWNVFTPEAPAGVGVDWLCVNGTQLLRVRTAPACHHGAWLMWRTECNEVA